MSKSSKDLQVNKQFTNLKLLGGNDCNSSLRQYPDLYVSGGARIKKTLCVDGNIVTNSAIIGDLMGDILGPTKVFGNLTILDNIIVDKNLCVFGNVKINHLVFDSLTTGNICVTGNLITDHIKEKTPAGIQIEGNVFINGGVIVAPNPFLIGGIENNFPFVVPDGSGPGCGCGGGGGSGVGWTDILFPAPIIPSQNWFATIVMGKTTMTCLVSGIYQVIIQGIWQQNATGIRAIRAYSTPGFLNAEADATVWSNIATYTQGATDMCVINAGDVVAVQARQTSGTTLNVVAKCMITHVS